MTLLRRVLGDTLRGRRLRQRRTLREVSGSARVSLGYLSEVERGQKEASSELLAAICEALDVKLSDLLREVSETMRRSERAADVRRVPGRVILPAPARQPVPAGVGGGPAPAERPDPLDEAFDADSFAEAFEEEFGAEGEPAAEPAGIADSLGGAPAAPGEEGGLDGVDLAELETGDGLGELEVLLGLTDLPGRPDGPYAARCLAAA
jgi:transcriptional regulator with XRE-family HTH domain